MTNENWLKNMIWRALYKINVNVAKQQLHVCNSSQDLPQPSHWINMPFYLKAVAYKVYIKWPPRSIQSSDADNDVS